MLLKKKIIFIRKKYKSCNLLVVSDKELILKSDFIELLFKVDKIFEFFFDSTRQEIKCLFLLKTKPQTFFKLLKKLLLGLFGGWFIKINLVGRGYNVYSSKKYLKFNLGYSHGIGLLIPNNLFVFCDKAKKDELILFSFDFIALLNFAYFLKRLKRLDSYKGKGIKFDKEIIILKSGKKSQY